MSKIKIEKKNDGKEKYQSFEIHVSLTQGVVVNFMGSHSFDVDGYGEDEEHAKHNTLMELRQLSESVQKAIKLLKDENTHRPRIHQEES